MKFKTKTKLSAVIILYSLLSSNALANWSPPMKVLRIDIHNAWKVRALFDQDVSADCPQTRLGEWSASADEKYMDRVLSLLMMAKTTDQSIRVWVSGCTNNLGQFGQTRIE